MSEAEATAKKKKCMGTLIDVLERYRTYLVSNVETMGYLEVCMKTFSYLAPSRISPAHSAAVFELFNSSSNLLIMFNDYLLRKHYGLGDMKDGNCKQLVSFLTAIEYIEVLIEIVARTYTNDTIKWILIFSVQLLKTVARFYLLIKYKMGLRCYPLLERLDRRLLPGQPNAEKGRQSTHRAPSPSSYTLPSSGRRIQSMNSPESGSVSSVPETPSVLNREQFIAESIHNIQPILHLCCTAVFGVKSWLPWVASLGLDLSSLAHLRQDKYRYTAKEKSELQRRTRALLMYLLRSPFYDRYSKLRIIRALKALSSLPVAHHLTGALMQYLPEWQQTYFYVWGSA